MKQCERVLFSVTLLGLKTQNVKWEPCKVVNLLIKTSTLDQIEFLLETILMFFVVTLVDRFEKETGPSLST
jgi:hypothetical protein